MEIRLSLVRVIDETHCLENINSFRCAIFLGRCPGLLPHWIGRSLASSGDPAEDAGGMKTPVEMRLNRVSVKFPDTRKEAESDKCKIF